MEKVASVESVTSSTKRRSSQITQMALTITLLTLVAGVLWRESSGVVQTNFPELPLLKVKGTHFQLGLQSVRDHTKHTAFNHAYQRLDDN